MAAELEAVLGASGPLLLDFDGPICGLFAGRPAPTVAEGLRRILADSTELAPVVLATDDPLEVLRWSGSRCELADLERVEDALRQEELAAVKSAAPTAYAGDVIQLARACGRPVAIVSNNSEPAIKAYLSAQDLDGQIDLVVGRAYAKPHVMKPDPESVVAAVAQLGVEPADCVFIGDSRADIVSGQAAGVRLIGLANRRGKADLLTESGADAIVTSMGQIATVLRCQLAATQ